MSGVKDLKNRSIHAYSSAYIVYGRRPLPGKTEAPLMSVETAVPDKLLIPQPPQNFIPSLLPQDLRSSVGSIKAASQDVAAVTNNVDQPKIAADTDKRRQKQALTASSMEKFSCPYFKRHPERHSIWTSCPGPGWDEVHRVKYVSSGLTPQGSSRTTHAERVGAHVHARHASLPQCPRF